MQESLVMPDDVEVVILIPDYDEDETRYPGDIKPGYYTHQELVGLLRTHCNNPEAIHFLADMLEP